MGATDLRHGENGVAAFLFKPSQIEIVNGDRGGRCGHLRVVEVGKDLIHADQNDSMTGADLPMGQFTSIDSSDTRPAVGEQAV